MSTTIIEQLIWIAVGLLTAIQLLYIFIIYNAIHRRHVIERKGKLGVTDKQHGISVVIVASDHEQQLAENLPYILTQDYPDYEVVVVDDNSQDDTQDLLQRLALQYPHLYSTFTSDSLRYISHKKLALTLGIKAAKKEWIVFTEPDCRPASNQWLAHMARHFTEHTDVVVGYSNYEHRSGFANLCYMYDTLLQQTRMLGLTLCRLGYMGIGNNMAYRRDIFFKNKGYSLHLDLERGEDDLFINEHVPARRIAAEVSAMAAMRSSTTSTHEWATNKLSRLFIRRQMHGIQPYLLGFETLSRVLFYIGIIGSIIYSVMNGLWITFALCTTLWIVRLISLLLVFHRTCNELGERRYNVSLTLFDLLQPLWELYFHLRLMFVPKRTYLRSKI